LVDIAVIRSNSLIYNPRVRKIAKSLSKRYSTLVLGWNREGVSRKTIDNYIADLKLFNLKAPFGKPSLVAYFPLYWTWILSQLFMYRPKVVHACDLDSVIPCYIYKVIFRKKLVFDVCDRYAMGYIPPKFRTIYSLVNSLEELIGKEADMLITVYEKLLETFSRKPKHCAIIMNCAEDHAIHRDEPKDNDDVLTLVYTGNIIRERGLEEITTVVKDLDGVELVIAGKVIDKELQDQISQISNVKYKGLLQVSDALTLEACSDVMVSLYDLKIPMNNFSWGNKLFEAMMLGIPIITNVSSDVINKVGCGIMVDYNDKNQIKDAIVCLRDNRELCRTLGNNGRKAFLQKYNWKIMEEELYKIYGNLLKN
jgi:glycosyltransferase involved in cell wall biosynthesis